MHGGDAGAAPYVFFAVDDMEEALRRVRELGGTVEEMNVEGDEDVDREVRPLHAVPRRPGVALRPAPAAEPVLAGGRPSAGMTGRPSESEPPPAEGRDPAVAAPAGVESRGNAHVSRNRAAPAFSAPTSATTCSAPGTRVICADNLETGSLENISHIRDGGLPLLDARHHEPLRDRGPVDAVYHMASPASPIDYPAAAAPHAQGRRLRHAQLAWAGQGKRARFLLASTSEVYGDPQVHPQPETYWGNVNPIGPRGVYDEAKRYAEALTMAYLRQQGVDTCIARIFNTYGARDAAARRTRDSDLPAPGARGQAGHGVRRRISRRAASATSTT